MAGSQYLKQAKQFFAEQKYADAVEYLDYHLEDESGDVRALTLKGAAQQRLQQHEKSVETFKMALKLTPENLMVWKGLSRSYFEMKQYEDYLESTISLLAIYAAEPTKEENYREAVNIFDRCRSFITRAGDKVPLTTRTTLLELQVPLEERTSPELNSIYAMFDGRIFPNYKALNTLIEMRQKDLATTISKITSRKKTSLNFTAANAAKQTYKAITDSKLEKLLGLKISVEDDDGMRRDAESDLLDLLVNSLQSVHSSNEKQELQRKVKSMVEGMVMFEPRNPLAFELSWDWDLPENSALKHTKIDGGEDNKDNQESTTLVLDLFVQLFPFSPISKVLEAHFSGDMAAKDKVKAFKKYKGECVYAWKLIAESYSKLKSFGPAIDAVHLGLEAITKRRGVYGMKLIEAERDFQVLLGEAYTSYQAPKNFNLAYEAFNKALASDPRNLEARVGKGWILSQQSKFKDSMAVLEAVVEEHPDNVLALSELAWCQIRFGNISEGIAGLKHCLSLPMSPGGQADLKWRIGYALWTDNKREESFDWFVSTLKTSPGHASAYTYLGLFYEDVAHDFQRAKRCYYKALELDNGQILAGERLAVDFANHKQWNLVETVATTVLSSGKLSAASDVEWPYRAMGIVCLNGGRYADGVKYFQKCLKSRPRDLQAWIGLGEAYLYSGRYKSGEKALARALKLEPTNFTALYIMSLAQRAVHNFPASAESLHKAMRYAPECSGALYWALSDNSLRAAEYFAGEAMLGDALEQAHQALGAVHEAMSSGRADDSEAALWGSVCRGLTLLRRIGRLSVKDVPDLEEVLLRIMKLPGFEVEFENLGEFACVAAEQYVKLASRDRRARRATAHFCAALAYYETGQIDRAIEHFKSSITLEPMNDKVWSAYGVCIQGIDPNAAQHCYVRSLDLSKRDDETWVRLAGLYITYEDPELAAEALDKALALNPDSCRAAIGQALVDSIRGTKSGEQLQRLLEYAYSLTNNDRLASYALAVKSFENTLASGSIALGALEKLLAAEPSNRDARLIMGLLLERRGDYESAIEHLEPLGEWCHIARNYLALGQYNDALSAASKEVGDSGVAQMSQCLTTGLANYFLGEFDASIEAFTAALELENTEDVLRLLVEVLYASGTEEARQVALEQLFDSISSNGPTLQVTLLLGVIGLLNKDSAVIEAAKAELEALITDEIRGESLAQVCHVLSLLDRSVSSFQRALFRWPTDYSLWRHVDKQQALLIATSQTTETMELSRANVEAGGVENCQRAVFLAPSSRQVWMALATSLSTETSTV